ncbi:class I SAM-dependent methyltransferase [Cellulomonas rhizosphaerae]|uniref:Class I SAM-dependent methyltransferase n=1 Tax=Cellulomonas rhizosphaerae TaxID=2293719 RepID=A0A413RPP1_9CELL|nr:class I SAM-dependent methyltransferase [Cellulomonas rhizosphaerae]RHA43894.1 class I SAM-dependent methyltransferase [Cellulomonas rhizosphaerae]
MSATESEAYWEERYRDREAAWGTNPNAVLVDVLGGFGLTPGDALDLGAGHGGDAFWLASLGWNVTAVDVSATALARVAQGAAARGLTVATEQHDLTRTLPDVAVDLLTATYFQTPLEIDRDAILRRAVGLVRPGGTLVVIDHGNAPPGSRLAHAHHHFPSVAETWASLALDESWDLARIDAPVRRAMAPDGEMADLTDNVIVAQRRR